MKINFSKYSKYPPLCCMLSCLWTCLRKRYSQNLFLANGKKKKSFSAKSALRFRTDRSTFFRRNSCNLTRFSEKNAITCFEFLYELQTFVEFGSFWNTHIYDCLKYFPVHTDRSMIPHLLQFHTRLLDQRY